MTEERKRVGDYFEGDMLQYHEPVSGQLRRFGLMVYTWDEETDHINLSVTPPEDGSYGMVLAYEDRNTYTGCTRYYKLLMGERFLWIASDLLKAPVKPDSL